MLSPEFISLRALPQHSPILKYRSKKTFRTSHGLEIATRDF